MLADDLIDLARLVAAALGLFFTLALAFARRFSLFAGLSAAGSLRFDRLFSSSRNGSFERFNLFDSLGRSFNGRGLHRLLVRHTGYSYKRRNAGNRPADSLFVRPLKCGPASRLGFWTGGNHKDQPHERRQKERCEKIPPEAELSVHTEKRNSQT